MFIDTGSTVVIQTIVNQFGLEYDNGKLSGTLSFPESLLTGTIDEDLIKTYEHVIKAYTSSIQEDCELAIYVGELHMYNRIAMRARGFEINDHDVIFIKDITHENYDRLNYYNNELGTTLPTEKVTAIALANWPTILIPKRCINDSDTYQLISTPRFDYVEGAKIFHAKLPVPITDLSKSSRKEYVLVEYINEPEYSEYKYKILVGGKLYVSINTKPTPDTLIHILSEHQNKEILCS